MTRLEVEVRDLRAALVAALPHVDRGKDPGALGYVRLLPGAQNLMVMATDRFSIGIGLVSIWEHEDDDLDPIDLHAEDVRRVLDVFKNPGKDVMDGEAVLQLATHRTTSEVSFTDKAGLLEGLSLTVPAITQDSFPSVDRNIARLLASPAHFDQGVPVQVNPATLGRFMVAGRAYGYPLVLEWFASATTSGGTGLVRCGESFIGAVQLMGSDDDTAADVDQWRLDWATRLPDPTTPDPDEERDREQGDDVDDDPGDDIDDQKPTDEPSNVLHVEFVSAGDPR